MPRGTRSLAVFSTSQKARNVNDYPPPPPNFANQTIWTGDNLPIMRGMNSASVDLIYLDPPFNSKANYAAPIGSQAAGAEFKDTWSLSDVDIAWLDLIEAKHRPLNKVIHAAMTKSDKSYLIYMGVRLIEMHRLLKPTGSIYLHCDPTMSHYLKLVMDAIWGRRSFQNEVIWNYAKWSNAARYFQRNHDVIFFYSGNATNHIFNRPYRISDDKKKKLEKGWQINVAGGKRQLIVYDFDKARVVNESSYDVIVDRTNANPGSPMPDVWSDLNIINSQAKERVGYPTQKPLELLRRIIRASSNINGIVLDPFAGCATACVAAQDEGREWVGIDISPKAADLVISRLRNELGMFADKSVTHRTDIPQRSDLGQPIKYNDPRNKKKLYGEQSGNCNGCKEHFQLPNLTVDHIIPTSKGGTDHIDNLQLLCGYCNSVKGNRGMEYLASKLAA